MKKVRIRADELRPGMYVSELDRPWEETPFLVQGFQVKDAADINEISKYCHFVHIDPDRTRAILISGNEPPAADFQLWESQLFMEKDFKAAQATFKKTANLLHAYLDNIRLGQTPGFELAKDAVSECISRIIANHQAAVFLTRLRGKGEKSGNHAVNVCVLTITLARLLGLDTQKQEQAGLCGLLHDMGDIHIPDSILNKFGKLTDEEMAIMREHTRFGRDILMSGTNMFSGAVDVAYGHHENLDGTGYPRGLQDSQINLNCRIVAVADRYEAITSPKSYRPAMDHLNALAALNKLAKAGKIDAQIASRFVAYLGVYPPGSIVEFNTGEIGIVLETNPGQTLLPLLLIVLDARKNPDNRIVDLAKAQAAGKGRPSRIVAVHPSGAFGIDLNHYLESLQQALSP